MFHENKIFRVKYLISKFPYSAQMQKKNEPEKLWIRILFMQCLTLEINVYKCKPEEHQGP